MKSVPHSEVIELHVVPYLDKLYIDDVYFSAWECSIRQVGRTYVSVRVEAIDSCLLQRHTWYPAAFEGEPPRPFWQVGMVEQGG